MKQFWLAGVELNLWDRKEDVHLRPLKITSSNLFNRVSHPNKQQKWQ